MQATMVATWLTELYLDQINRALLEEAPEQAPPPLPASPTSRGPPSPTAKRKAGEPDEEEEGEGASKESPVVTALTKRLRSFLAKHVEVLDRQVTVSLLASYGRLDDLMHYASLRQVGLPPRKFLDMSHAQPSSAAGILESVTPPESRFFI